jgi:hypothetical protein
MSVKPVTVGCMPELPKTAPAAPSYLTQLSNKVSEFTKSRWPVIILVGLMTTGAVSILSFLVSTVPLLQSVLSGLAVGGVATFAAWRLVPPRIHDLKVFTLNFLGIWSDPFEFKGKYGKDIIDNTKKEVNDVLIGKAPAGKKGITDADIQSDLNYGPTLTELMPPQLWQHIAALAQKNGLDMQRIGSAQQFITKYGPAKLFYYFRNCHEALLGLDLKLREKAQNSGATFDFPIVSSPAEIDENIDNALTNLADRLFTQEARDCAVGFEKENVKWADNLPKARDKIRNNYQYAQEAFRRCAGTIPGTDRTDVTNFLASKEGELVFYFLYQAMNLRLIHSVPGLPKRVNQAKAEFTTSSGDIMKRAEFFANKYAEENAGIVCVQECNAHLINAMRDRGFVSTEYVRNKSGGYEKRSSVGAVIFLNAKIFKRDYQDISYSAKDKQHKSTAIVAELLHSSKKVFINSFHGSSSTSSEATTWIREAHDQYKKSSADIFVSAGDTNANDQAEINAVYTLADQLKCVGTNLGNTTAKEREITPQPKVGILNKSQKDIIITNAKIEKQTLDFKEHQMEEGRCLPDGESRSDHLTGGAVLKID